MKRVYETLLGDHLARHRQMAMITGPRQVGKTTTSRASAGEHRYFSWDNQGDRKVIVGGADAVAHTLGMNDLRVRRQTAVFDEIHKYRHWKSFLKGFFDVYGDNARVLVTGSSRLGVYRRGGDSLLGRYFIYRMHPITLAELIRADLAAHPIRTPKEPPRGGLEQLLRFGGFPEPFLKGEVRFYNRWAGMRQDLLFREDLRDLTRIQEVGQVQLLAELLTAQSGQLVNYSRLATSVNASVDSVRRWIAALESLFFCYTIRPWFRNVPKSLRKQPKLYLWDWSGVEDAGWRWENLVASHLLKAVHWWTDAGLGRYELYYLRDKNKREVDFLVARNRTPWFIVEAKNSGEELNPNLAFFQKATGAKYALQVVREMEYVDASAFRGLRPLRVPALTFLSQLV